MKKGWRIFAYNGVWPNSWKKIIVLVREICVRQNQIVKNPEKDGRK